MAVIGYAMVSTDGQSSEAQVAELRAAGATKVFQEKASGIVSDRAALKRTMASVQAGDVLLVTRLDRLARSTRDLLNILDDLSSSPAEVAAFVLFETRGPTRPRPMVA